MYVYNTSVFVYNKGMPIRRTCVYCGKEFSTKQFFIDKGQGKYCSRDCAYAHRKKGKECTCAVCGKKTYKTMTQLERSKSRKYFCSKGCQTVWRNTQFVGEKHANWKDGNYAYKSVLSRAGIAPVCIMCGNTDSRVMAVHHRDENRKNNKVENLVWICHNCHHLVHYHEDEKKRLAKKPIMVPIA